jgi:hypothetical protein
MKLLGKGTKNKKTSKEYKIPLRLYRDILGVSHVIPNSEKLRLLGRSVENPMV